MSSLGFSFFNLAVQRIVDWRSDEATSRNMENLVAARLRLTFADLNHSSNTTYTYGRTKTGFKLISKHKYVDLFLKANPSEFRRDVIARLDEAIGAHRDGERCNCGEPIWIVGSAEAGYGCLTCITGESAPTSDFEIDVSRTAR